MSKGSEKHIKHWDIIKSGKDEKTNITSVSVSAGNFTGTLDLVAPESPHSCVYFNIPQVDMFVSLLTELLKDILILFTSPITGVYPLSDTHASPKRHLHERQKRSNQKCPGLRCPWGCLDSESITSRGLCIWSSAQLLKANQKRSSHPRFLLSHTD